MNGPDADKPMVHLMYTCLDIKVTFCQPSDESEQNFYRQFHMSLQSAIREFQTSESDLARWQWRAAHC